MNNGLPNISNLEAKVLVGWTGITNPILTWILTKVADYFLFYINQHGLILIDKLESHIIVKNEQNTFVDAEGKAWALVDLNKGKVLTPEEMDAIDKPVIDAFVKFATFNRVSKSS